MVNKSEDLLSVRLPHLLCTTMNVINRSNTWFLANRQPVHQLHAGISSSNIVNFLHFGLGHQSFVLLNRICHDSIQHDTQTWKAFILHSLYKLS